MPMNEWLSKIRRTLASWVSRAEFPYLVLFLLAALSLWLFVELADEVMEGESLPFDRAVIEALRTPGDLSDPIGPAWFEEAVRDVTALGGTAILTLVTVAALGFLWIERKPRTILFLLIAVVGGLILSLLLKAGFSRPRPDFLPHGQEVYTASFPSGHSMNAAVVYMTIGAILAQTERRRAVKLYVLALVIFLAVVVGLSRIYLGVHWPTDVLAGWTAGAGWAMLCWFFALRLRRRKMLEQETALGEPAPEEAQGDYDEAPPPG